MMEILTLRSPYIVVGITSMTIVGEPILLLLMMKSWRPSFVIEILRCFQSQTDSNRSGGRESVILVGGH